MEHKPYIPYRYTLAHGNKIPVKPASQSLTPPAAEAPAAGQVKATDTRPREMRFLTIGWMAIAIPIIGLALWAHMLIGLNNDHLGFMDQVRKLISGGIPYVDYTDANPPLIHILYILPFLLAKVTGIPLYVTLYLFVYGAIGGSLLLCDRILRHSDASWNTRMMAMTTIALTLLGISFAHQVFADRDHLMLILTAPWLVLCSPLAKREAVPYQARVIIAIMGAVGFAIKPYFYIFYLATVIFTLCVRPWRELFRQRAQYTVWGFAFFYLVLIFSYFPQYLLTVLPVGLQTYSAIAWSWASKWDVINHELLSKFVIPGFTATLLLLCAFHRFLDSTVAYVYLLLLAGLGSYALNFGWYYTQYPFIAFAFVLAVVTASKLLQAMGQIRITALRWPAMLVILIATIGQLGYFFALPIMDRAKDDMVSQRERGHPFTTKEMQPEAAEKINRYLDSHPRFMFFTVNLWSVNLLQAGTKRENVGRFDILWPLPGILRLRDAPEGKASYESLSAWFNASLAFDIQNHKPDMIINDISPVKRSLPLNYNMMDLMNTSPRFKAAMGDYALADKVDYCNPTAQRICAFEVYYRK